MRLIRLCLVLLALGLVLAGLVVGYAWHDYRQPGPLSEEKILLIDAGTSFRQIVRQLEEGGVVRHPSLYQLGVALRGDQARFKAGEYRFTPGMTPEEVTAILVSGKSIPHSVTVPEGRVSADIRAVLLAEEALRGEVPDDLPEGTLLPETYFFLRGETRAAVVQRMREAMTRTLEALWDARAPDLPLATPQEALTLASIVEKETGVADERGRVAAVFLNRLRAGMPLQSDPTTIYGLYRQTGMLKQALSRADLATENPYNTYTIPGLPPGPICHPGKASLQAVLQPPQTNELYFVADGQGGHRFAATLAEHNRNVARYRAAQRAASAPDAPLTPPRP
jgi:UPF0755 protein